MVNEILKIENLSKTFKNKLIFKNINLSIKKGTICGFVGYNGSGKSIFFKIICGFILPDTGTITINGKCLMKDIDFPESTGVLIETPYFIEEYNQIKNLKFLASIKNEIGDDEIINSLKQVGLDINNNDKVKKFSLGMRQRLGIAQAIMEKPQLLILDEPFNGLDKSGVRQIKDLILELNKQGTTILLTSHISGDLEELCNEIYEFDNYTLNKIR